MPGRFPWLYDVLLIGMWVPPEDSLSGQCLPVLGWFYVLNCVCVRARVRMRVRVHAEMRAWVPAQGCLRLYACARVGSFAHGCMGECVCVCVCLSECLIYSKGAQ